MAGYHEVMYAESTKKTVQRKLEENKNGANNIMWRISSTLFSHFRYDVDISPLEEMKELHDKKLMKSGKYDKKMTAHEKLEEELMAINLKPKIEVPAGGE